MPCTKERLLIVDDEPAIRTSMSLLLAEIGYRVRSAHDGFSALRELRKEIPDILLSDLNMPGMSGFELLLVVQRRFPEILVIAMSGAFSGSEIPSGVSADAFYQKGSSMSALIQILRAPPKIRRSVQPTSGGTSPLWIQRNGSEPLGKAQVAIACPECLRAFPQVFKGSDSDVREVDCIHCGNSIQFEVVESSNRMPQQAFRRGAGTAFAAHGTSTASN